MTAAILLSLITILTPESQAQSQMSLPGLPVTSPCDFIFKVLPASNDADQSAYTVALGKDISALHRYDRIEVYFKDETDPTLDQLRYEFSPGDGIEVQDMEFTKDNKYLIVSAKGQSLIYHLGIKPSLVFSSIHDSTQFIHYDAQNQRIVVQAGEYLRVQNLRENRVEMLVPATNSRSLARAISNNEQEFFHMIYIAEENNSGRFLIEKNDPTSGKMVGVLSTNFSELRWYRQDKVLSLLNKKDTPENRSAFMMRSIQMGFLESIRYLLRNPGAPLAP